MKRSIGFRRITTRKRVWTRLWLAGALLGVLALGACAPRAGSEVIAFLRDGQLWTVNADGSDVTSIVSGHVVGFAWSPDHHQMVIRFGGAGASATAFAGAPDAPSSLGIVSVDGGNVLAITPDAAGVARSDAWWNGNGNRLVYREGFPPAAGQEPTSVLYWLSQSDQPVGIARKPILDTASIPAPDADGSRIAVIDPLGRVRVGAANTTGRVVASGALQTLANGSRPARVLWQPHHQAVLFAQIASDGTLELALTNLDGHALAAVQVTDVLDYAFSPDGLLLAIRTPAGFEIRTLDRAGEHTAALAWPDSDPAALAWWSPDGRYLLVRDHTGLQLADTRHRTVRQLLTSTEASAGTVAPQSWHPLAGSPWSADGRRVVFADSGTGNWLGHALPSPLRGSGGLYVADVMGSGTPTLIDSGADLWPTWSGQDASASFLVAS